MIMVLLVRAQVVVVLLVRGWYFFSGYRWSWYCWSVTIVLLVRAQVVVVLLVRSHGTSGCGTAGCPTPGAFYLLNLVNEQLVFVLLVSGHGTHGRGTAGQCLWYCCSGYKWLWYCWSMIIVLLVRHKWLWYCWSVVMVLLVMVLLVIILLK